jgi:hypothetical protein
MVNKLTKAQEWGQLCGFDSSDTVTQVKCFYEELEELLDAYCDMRVVCENIENLGYPAISERDYVTGFEDAAIFSQQTLDDAYNEVCHSLMSKFCKSTTTADLSVLKYEKEGVKTYYKKVGDYYVIYSKCEQTVSGKNYPLDKVLKGINYRLPNLRQFL